MLNDIHTYHRYLSLLYLVTGAPMAGRASAAAEAVEARIPQYTVFSTRCPDGSQGYLDVL